jgi:AAA15 family ATPase/GTPase
MLQALEIKNFTVFEEAKLEFSPGLNVVIGENGTGKSQLLKLGYVILKSLDKDQKDPMYLIFDFGEVLAKEFIQVFRPDLLGNLVTHNVGQQNCEVKAGIFSTSAKLDFSFSKISKAEVSTEAVPTRIIHPKPIFMPTREILSIYNGFAAALRNRELEFDNTFLDLADALALTPLKGEAAEKVKPFLETFEKQMDGKVVIENGRFYISTDNQKLEMPLVAEGIRKIAMLAYLLMNGSLQKGTTLFWDEPETNLNPKMIRYLAETLVVLSSMGIQIVLATHSLFLLRELQIQLALNPNVPAQFFALKREGKSVTVQQGNSIEDVDPIAALDADLEQTDRYLELT